MKPGIFRNRDAARVPERLSRPYRIKGKEVVIGASTGISRFQETVGAEEELLKKADRAMYEIKASGKNAARLYRE